MPRFSYFLGALVLSGALMTLPAFARSGDYWDGDNTGKSPNQWQKNESQKRAPSPKKQYPQSQAHQDKSPWGANKDHKAPVYEKPTYKAPVYKKHVYKAPVYKAPPSYPLYKRPPSRPKGTYHAPTKPYYYKPNYQPYRYSYYYRPNYIYVTPHYRHWYYGYYPYRGFYWPFAHVTFVIRLSAIQIELHHQAIYAALDAPVGQVISWSRDGSYGTVVVLRDGYDEYGNLCKQYRQTIRHHGQVTTEVSISCLTPDGYWVSP